MRVLKWKFVIFLIIVSMFTSGCLGSSENEDVEEKEIYIYETFQMEGHLDGWAQQTAYSIKEEVHFEVPAGDVGKITINITVEDGDDNTETDTVTQIRMWRETGRQPAGIKTAPGGSTPYHSSITFEYDRDEGEVNWWIVEITATIAAGEDQWIGPFLWSGVTDTGVDFFIDTSIGYYATANA